MKPKIVIYKKYIKGHRGKAQITGHIFRKWHKKIASWYSQEKKNVNLLLIIVPSKFRIKGFFFCLFVIFFGIFASMTTKVDRILTWRSLSLDIYISNVFVPIEAKRQTVFVTR